MTPEATQSLEELLARGRNEQARELAQQRLARDPKDGQALLTLAKLAVLEGQFTRAEELLQRASPSVPRQDVTLVRATLAYQQADLPRALELYTSLVRDPSAPAGAWYGLGITRIAMKDAQAAAKVLERAVELAPTQPSYHFELGRARAMLGQYRAAVRQFVLCLGLDPRDERAWVFIADIAFVRGKPRSAQRVLAQGARLMPDSTLLRERAQALASAARSAPASAPASAPDERQAVFEQTAELLKQHRNRQAIQRAREATDRGIHSAPLKVLEARAYEGLLPPDLNGAVRAYEEAMALDPSAWEACNNLGLVLLRQGKRQAGRAVEVLREARRRAPDRPEPTFNLAVACSKAARVDESVELAHHLIATLPPEHPFHGYAQGLLRTLKRA